MRISGILGKGEIVGNRSCDTGLSIVKTDWNCVLSILAISSAADTLFPDPSLNEQTPEMSDQQCLMKVQNLFIPDCSLLPSPMGVMIDST